MDSKKKEELDKIIEEENLNKEATYEIIKRSFESGMVETTGTSISKVLPAMTRFDVGNRRSSKKKTVINKLIDYFNRFFNISNRTIYLL